MTAGDHNLRIEYASGGFVSLDAIEIVAAPTIFSSGTYDDGDAGLSYSGSWQTMSGAAGPYLGTLHYSYRVEDLIQAYFTGEQITISYFAGPDAGIADVYLDGVKVVSLNEYSDNWEWQTSWTSDLLIAGDHSLRIVYASGSSSSSFTSLDSLVVLP